MIINLRQFLFYISFPGLPFYGQSFSKIFPQEFNFFFFFFGFSLFFTLSTYSPQKPCLFFLSPTFNGRIETKYVASAFLDFYANEGSWKNSPFLMDSLKKPEEEVNLYALHSDSFLSPLRSVVSFPISVPDLFLKISISWLDFIWWKEFVFLKSREKKNWMTG